MQYYSRILRRKIFIILIIPFIVIFGIVAERLLHGMFEVQDEFLENTSDYIASQIIIDEDKLHLNDLDVGMLLEISGNDADGVFMVLDKNFQQQYILSAPSVSQKDVEALIAKIEKRNQTRRIAEYNFHYRFQIPMRFLVHRTNFTHGGDPYYLVIGYESDDLWREFFRVSAYTFLLLLSSLIIILFLVNRIIKRVLKPLRDLCESISRMHDFDDLNIPDDGTRVFEIQTLRTALKNLFERLHVVYDHQKEFLAHVAHELRTPLGGIRAISELALRKERSSQKYQESLNKSLAITLEMQQSIENLMELSKVEAGSASIEYSEFSIQELIKERLERLAERMKKRNLSIHMDCAADKAIYGSVSYMRILLKNIIENSCCYAPEDSEIEIKVSENEESISIEIRNQTLDLKPEDIPCIWERLWRKDSARSSGNSHFGVGLTMVREIAAALNLGLSASVKNGLFSIKVSVPIGNKVNE